MKGKLKKIFTGAALCCVGVGTLTGCSITPEQQNALDAITNNTESLVESFDHYLVGQNQKLDKETAYDMLRQAKIKSQYVFDESNICEISVSMNDELNAESIQFNMNAVYDFSGNRKKMMVIEKNNNEESLHIGNYNTEDVNKSYEFSGLNGATTFTKLNANWYAINIFANVDALAQAGIDNIDIDDITNVSVNESGEYTFNIVKTAINEVSNELVMQTVNFVEIVVKDYLFKSVNIQQIRKQGSASSFRLDSNDQKIEDGYGSYIFSGDVIGVINLDAKYKYGKDVILDEMNTKIAEIDAKIASGELVIPA